MKPLHFASFCQKMVGLAARRGAVAHLQAALGLSERRACSIVASIGRWCAAGPAGRRSRNCAAGCVSFPTGEDALAITACPSCCVGRASRQGSSASTGPPERKGSRCATEGHDAGGLKHALRS